jgi:colicin import membrane protein
MASAAAENLKYFGGALGVHAGLVLLLIAAGLFHRQPVQPSLTLTAVMVDRATLNQLRQQSEPAPPAPTPEPEAEAKLPEPDPAELQKQKAQEQAELLKKQQLQQQAEREKQLLLQKQVEAERQKQQLEVQRKAAEAEQKKQQQEAEKKRLADIQQKQREAEQKRQADAETKAQQSREAELNAQLAAEEGRASAVNAGLLNQYVALIQQRVMRYWIKPPTAKVGLECEVKVTQATGGTVLSVSVGRCNGDQAARSSIEAAVYAASPLPMPPDARLFDRNLTFLFRPTE